MELMKYPTAEEIRKARLALIAKNRIVYCWDYSYGGNHMGCRRCGASTNVGHGFCTECEIGFTVGRERWYQDL